MKNKKEEDRQGFVIGGGVMLGLGVGFFLLTYSALAFVGSILSGIGLGLIVAAFVKEK